MMAHSPLPELTEHGSSNSHGPISQLSPVYPTRQLHDGWPVEFDAQFPLPEQKFIAQPVDFGDITLAE